MKVYLITHTINYFTTNVVYEIKISVSIIPSYGYLSNLHS